MSTLKTLINKRKFIRKSVTKNNDKRGQFSMLSAHDKLSKKYTFESWLTELKNLDDKILSFRYDEWDEETLEAKY